MKKIHKILLGIAGAAAALAMIAAAAVSPAAKHYIEKHDRELIGRTIRMERLRANVFTGRLRIDGLVVGGAEDSAAFFRLDSFDMRLRLLPLLGRRVHITRLHLTGPDMKVYQRGERFDFDDLTARFAGDTAQTDEAPSAPWEVGIYDIAIRRGHIFYKDLALDAVWGLNDVNLRIPGVCFSGEQTDVGAVLEFAEGGSLATQVGYDIASSAFDIGLRLRDFSLGGTLPYFRQALDISDVEGRLSADVTLKGDLEHLLALRAEGTASLADFALLDARQRRVAGVDTLGVRLAEADLGRSVFRFDRIYVGGPSALVEFTPEGDNLSALVKGGEPAPDGTSAAEAAAAAELQAAESGSGAQFTIGDLEIQRGCVDLHDLTLERPFEYRISEIRMRSRDFDPAKHNRLTVDARMQQTGSARLRWDGTLYDLDNQSLTLSLTNIDLKDFTPYCEHYTAYPLSHGNLTFRSQNTIRNRNLDGTNHLDMFDPRVEKKLKGMKPEMNLPLKLGLYVLKDKKGHVRMDLPVKGNLDAPEFSYRKIVLKAIGNVLLKVATAPFSFLTGGGGELDCIPLEASQFAFTSEQYALFDRIAAMLREKPDMHATLAQRIDLERALPEAATTALQMAYAEHRRSADSTAGRTPMSLLEYEKIRQTDIRSAEIGAFADSLLLARGASPRGLSAESKAITLYREQATERLIGMMRGRNRALADYMQRTHGLNEPALRVEPLDSTATIRYKGRDRYLLSVEVEGETATVSEDTPADDASAGTAAGTDAAGTDAAPDTPAGTPTGPAAAGAAAGAAAASAAEE